MNMHLGVSYFWVFLDKVMGMHVNLLLIHPESLKIKCEAEALSGIWGAFKLTASKGVHFLGVFSGDFCVPMFSPWAVVAVG